MMRRNRHSGDNHVGSLGDDGITYRPPTRRKRAIRVRWYAPIAVVACIAAFVVFVVTGPDYNQRLVLERADGTEHEICAARLIVNDGLEPQANGALAGTNAADQPTWLDADQPSELEIASGGGLVTYFDEDGRAFDRRPGEPWASALVEPSAQSSGPYVALDARGGC